MATISRTSSSPVTSKPASAPASAPPRAAEVCTPDDPTGARLRDGFDDAPTPPPVALTGALLTGTSRATPTPDGGSVTGEGALASVTATTGNGTLTASLGAVSGKREHEVEGARLSGSAEGALSALQVQGTTTAGGTTVTTTTTVGTLGGSVEAKGNPAFVSAAATGTLGTTSTEVKRESDSGATTTASVSGPSLEYGVEASGNLTMGGVDVKLDMHIDATLAEANVSRTQTIPVEIGGEPYEVEVNLEAMGKVGAEGSLTLELHVGPNGTTGEVELDGFAGAQASLTGGIKLMHEGDLVAQGELVLSASAGTPSAGAFGFDAGYENGMASLSFEAASAGVSSLGVKVEAKVDPAEVSEAAYDTVTGPLRDAFSPVSPEEQQRALDEMLESYGTTYVAGA